MWRYWWYASGYDDPPLVGWPVAALFGLSLVLLGLLIVIEPAVLALLVATLLVGTGLLVLVPALAAGWVAWRRRPRRIRIRTAR